MEFFKTPTKTDHYKPAKLSPTDWKNGIIVRSPNWLGDIAMALPTMCVLQKLLPESCSFYVACPDSYYPLFKSIPWVTDTISLGTGHNPWSKECIGKVKKLNLGVGFLFVNSLRSAYYFKKSGVKNIFGASNGIRNFFLTKSFKVKWHTKERYESAHQTYKYLAMAYALGAEKWDNKFPKFKIPNPKKSELLPLKNQKNILAIHPGAKYGPAKMWPAKCFKEVCQYWIKKTNGKIVVLGLKDESKTAQKVLEGLPAEHAINLVGKTSLLDLMWVLKKSDLCICNDSGTMHLASAMNTKGIAIFGSTDPYATGPLGDNWIVMLKKQDCAPCFSRECKNPQKDYKCLHAITPKAVIEVIAD